MKESVTTIEQINGTYQEPKILESFFVSSTVGVLEIPLAMLPQFQIMESRLKELGHLPVGPLVFAAEQAEVQGHHKVPGNSGAGGTDWRFHTDWQFGCYYDSSGGGFMVGFHRHPYMDERAVGAEPKDFS